MNADVGEDELAVTSGAQAALLDLVHLANVACGAHAGSEQTIDATVRQCAARGVLVGAHPSTPDREGFGRRPMNMPLAALGASVREQVALVARVAAAAGVAVHHVKPHGALYHQMSDDAACARAMRSVCEQILPHTTWVLRARSAGLAALRADGASVLAEGFVDRRYDADGALVPRGEPGALLESPEAAAAQALALAHQGDTDTLCIHGDGADALAIARAVRQALFEGSSA